MYVYIYNYTYSLAFGTGNFPHLLANTVFFKFFFSKFVYHGNKSSRHNAFWDVSKREYVHGSGVRTNISLNISLYTETSILYFKQQVFHYYSVCTL